MTLLYDYCLARLRDSRESGDIDPDTPDAVLAREAFNLERELGKAACSFVDNDFDDREGAR
jgi:hypothetical protein